MKRASVCSLVLGTVALAACTPVSERAGAPEPRLPEEVLAIAAPGQDLTSARLVPETGCYWYTHRNVVETTLVPLRTANGNPICARTAS